MERPSATARSPHVTRDGVTNLAKPFLATAAKMLAGAVPVVGLGEYRRRWSAVHQVGQKGWAVGVRPHVSA